MVSCFATIRVAVESLHPLERANKGEPVTVTGSRAPWTRRRVARRGSVGVGGKLEVASEGVTDGGGGWRWRVAGGGGWRWRGQARTADSWWAGAKEKHPYVLSRILM
jgi:hypothetical protein